MSKGPGIVERRIADLMAATRDRALSIEEIADNAYALAGQPPTRAQRLAATRAVHRLLKRLDAAQAEHATLRDAGVSARRRQKLWQFVYDALSPSRCVWYTRRIEDGESIIYSSYENWRTTLGPDHRLYLHPPNVPVRLWAVNIDPAGVHWFDAEILRITETRVSFRYDGETGFLDRSQLWRSWANYRGVMFVSSRTGRTARRLDEIWWNRFYGDDAAAGTGPPPALQMQLARAIELLGGLPNDYTRDDVIAAFRRAVKRAHPDAGGTAEMFRMIVEARDRVLASVGEKAAPPKPPAFYPAGAVIRYRTVSRSQARLGSTRMLR